jgi:hypothetical protein
MELGRSERPTLRPPARYRVAAPTARIERRVEGGTPWLLCAECVIGGAKRFRSKSFAGRGSDPSGSDRTDPALKMPVGEAICLLQLVDKTVLEGMGPPTVGFDARSELPTDPHGPSGASGGRTSVATRIS